MVCIFNFLGRRIFGKWFSPFLCSFAQSVAHNYKCKLATFKNKKMLRNSLNRIDTLETQKKWGIDALLCILINVCCWDWQDKIRKIQRKNSKQ